MIGTSNPLARSLACRVERASTMSVVNPTWLLVMRWIVPPVRYPGQRSQVERLGYNTLTREGRIAMDDDWQCRSRIVVRFAPAP